MKNLNNFVLVVLLLVVATMQLSSCGDDKDKDDAPNTPKKEYTISYSTEYSKEYDKIVEEGKKLTEKELPELQYKDYEFLGWYVGGEKISVGYEVTGNLTLTAKWKLPEDTEVGNQQKEDDNQPPKVKDVVISYSTDKGNTPQKDTIKSGSQLTNNDLPIMIAEGWDFLGWYDGDKKIEVGYTIKDNLDLTARWTEKMCTLTFKTIYGKDPEPILNVPYGTKLEKYLPKLKASGHIFAGWECCYTHLSDECFYPDNLTIVRDDCILNALWLENDNPTHYFDFAGYDDYKPNLNELRGKRFRYSLLQDTDTLLSYHWGLPLYMTYFEVYFCEGSDTIEFNLLDSEYNIINKQILQYTKESTWKYCCIFRYGKGLVYTPGQGSEATGESSASIYDDTGTSFTANIFYYKGELYISFDGGSLNNLGRKIGWLGEQVLEYIERGLLKDENGLVIGWDGYVKFVVQTNFWALYACDLCALYLAYPVIRMELME
ncbi:MAG: InlB B-repeat-containing protein [Bacteroidales bacterium]|nr:InlB B-repeat-containing protein [Bacteroidales bacterium]